MAEKIRKEYTRPLRVPLRDKRLDNASRPVGHQRLQYPCVTAQILDQLRRRAPASRPVARTLTGPRTPRPRNPRAYSNSGA